MSARKIVKDEIQEVRRIRDGFADKKLLNKALQDDWSTYKYQQKVIEKVFGKPKLDKKSAISPMHLNPTTCTIHENWNIAMYRRKGLPDIIYYADRAHEAVHRKSCLAKTSPMVYNASISFADKLSKEEVTAYNAKIKVLQKWLRVNGAILEQWFAEHCR